MIGSRHHLGLVSTLALTLAGCADSLEPSKIGSYALKSDAAPVYAAALPDLRGEREQQ